MTAVRFDDSAVPVRLCLAGSWTIAQAAALREELMRALNRELGTACEVDLSAVHEIDTAGVQLLVALARCLREAGPPVRLRALSPSVQRVALALGASDEHQCFGWALPGAYQEAVLPLQTELELQA